MNNEKITDNLIDYSLIKFSEKGYEKTTVKEITDEAGVVTPGITKRGIMSSIFRRYKKTASGNFMIDETLMEELHDPLRFLTMFSEKLLRQWNMEEEKRFFNLFLSVLNREFEGETYSLHNYLMDIRSTLWMVFDEMIKLDYIKPMHPVVLAYEFLNPLIFIRMEFLSGGEFDSYENALEAARAHVEFFWESVEII